jgi:hypothetical protein
VNHCMSIVDDTPEERDFRERYALELRKKKVERYVSLHFGSDELSDELKKVKRQEMVSPGRRGEQIKLEEISKEIIRRLSLSHHHQQLKKKEIGNSYAPAYVEM